MTDSQSESKAKSNVPKRKKKRYEVSPWYYASLFVKCPVCSREVGEYCVNVNGYELRDKHHYVRYRKARATLRSAYLRGVSYRYEGPTGPLYEGYAVPGSPIKEGSQLGYKKDIPSGITA